MKKTFLVFLAIAMLLSVFPFVSVSAAEEDYCLNIAIDSVNGERTAASVVVYTDEFGESTKTKGNGVELSVDENGIVAAIDKNDSPIIKNGFVISFGATKRNLVSMLKVGAHAYFDKEHNAVTIVSEGYNPFTSTVIEYDAINAIRAENKLIIYRDKAETGTNTWGVEAVVNADGYVVSVGGNNNAIPDGGFVISGVGNKKQIIESACNLGYKAVLDEASRTVTVSYEKENALESYVLRKNEYYKAYENALNSFSDIWHEAVKSSIAKLESLCEKMKAPLESDNIGEFMALAYSFECESAVCADTLVPFVPVESRALWLRIPTKSDTATVEKTVKEIHEMGFNSVCIEILFDSTTIMPMPESSLFEQNPAFKGNDMLKLYTDEFHKYDIEVHAWMSCYRVGHDGSSNVKYSVAKKKPEWLNTDQNGSTTVNNEYGNAYFLNPALTEVREFLLETYRYILENYAIDGFQLDYVRYPENTKVNYGYDEYTVTEFCKKYAMEKAPTASSQKGWNEWCEFRASFVTQLVTEVGALIKEIRPDVLFSCDVAPDYATSKTKMCQDSQKWISEGLVDIIYPMAYGTTDAVAKWTGITVDLAGNKVQTVIGLRDNGAAIYREQIIRARECNADGTAFFSYSQYVAGDYEEFIKNTVFSKEAFCPSYNAKNAVIAQLLHICETVDERMPLALTSVPQDIKDYANALSSLADKLKDSDINAQKTEIENAVKDGYALADLYKSSENGISEYLESALRVVEKTALNSRDAEKAAYAAENTPKQEESQENDEASSNDDETNELSVFERIVQIFFIIVMTVGVLGLPVYYWLNARKKRITESDSVDNGDDSCDEPKEDAEIEESVETSEETEE